jgi:outer membrane protein insertion porin family
MLEKSSFNNNVLYFYIDEGDRFIIDDFVLDIKDNFIKNILSDDIDDFKKKLEKNNFFYNKKLIEDYIELFNQNLISNNINNQVVELDVSDDLNSLSLLLYMQKIDPVIISKISITGNSITKDRTIRSKIFIEPGQYLNKYTLDKSIKNLKRFPYINDLKSSTNIIDQLAEITLDIDEEKKTGNILVAGTLNSDTGAGLTFGIEDKNIFGSGNSISSNFTVNSEDLKFDLNYVQYPILNPNLTNTYTIFNQDNDYTSSFGYKASRKGIGYLINFNQNDKLSYGAGFNYEEFKGHSAVNKSSAAINDNIGNFDNYNLNLSVKYDSSDDYFYPTNGTINKLDFSISPKDISDNSYYKVSVSNKNYRQLKKSTNYFFLNNNYGFAKSLNGKLKTINAFGLGGLNFKGFDYKGIGPNDGSIYLGGNEYFTTTLGYGSSFIFDDKDNINVKFFLTAGSIWNSDYDTSSDADLRTSLGTSFDFITPIGPISFSYATPINKKDIDKSRPFNFTIGTSF